ncbi:MAG: ABC transporter permease [Spirochaetota bacterium]
MKKRARALGIPFFVALAFIIAMGAAAAAAPVLSGFSPTSQNLGERFNPPGKNGHVLGTDDFGRDQFSRILYGSRSALLVGVVAVAISVSIGTIFGLVAGLAGKGLDSFLMFIMDSLLSFPTVLLAITVVSFLGYGLVQVMVAIGVIYSPVFARLVRAETLSLKTEGYVESSRALGSTMVKTVYLHIVPNLLGKVVVQCSITFALSIVVESSLSFLGLGTQPPNPSWGLMLKDARNFLALAPWMAIFPGLAIALAVLSFNILGDSISERLNPRIYD